MTTHPLLRLLAGLLLSAAALVVPRALAQAPSGRTLLDRVGFDQKLGQVVPRDLRFVDDAGRPVTLGDYMGKRPLILVMVYLRCPMLCGKELEGLTRCLRAVAPSVGNGFDVLTVSFDPNEQTALAAAKKRNTLDAYDRPRADRGWHFLTGDSASINRLAESIGFRFSPIAGTSDFAHAAGIVVLSPDGLITRYFFGVDYPSKDVQASLENARADRVSAPVAKWLMLCYEYDPATGKYTLAIMRITQILGALTLLALAVGVGVLVWRDRNRKLSSAAV